MHTHHEYRYWCRSSNGIGSGGGSSPHLDIDAIIPPRNGDRVSNFPASASPPSPTRRRTRIDGYSGRGKGGARGGSGDWPSCHSDGAESESTTSHRSYGSSSDDDDDGEGEYTTTVTSPASARRYYHYYDRDRDGPCSYRGRDNSTNRGRRSGERRRNECEHAAPARTLCHRRSSPNNGTQRVSYSHSSHCRSSSYGSDRDRSKLCQCHPRFAAAQSAEYERQQQQHRGRESEPARRPPWFSPRTRA